MDDDEGIGEAILGILESRPISGKGAVPPSHSMTRGGDSGHHPVEDLARYLGVPDDVIRRAINHLQRDGRIRVVTDATEVLRLTPRGSRVALRGLREFEILEGLAGGATLEDIGRDPRMKEMVGSLFALDIISIDDDGVLSMDVHGPGRVRLGGRADMLGLLRVSEISLADIQERFGSETVRWGLSRQLVERKVRVTRSICLP